MLDCHHSDLYTVINTGKEKSQNTSLGKTMHSGTPTNMIIITDYELIFNEENNIFS